MTHKTHNEDTNSLRNLGIVLTIVIIIIFFCIGCYYGFDPKKLNEISSFLSAGISALAFTFLILSFKQQQENIKLQRKDLKEQRLIMEEQRDQMKSSSLALMGQLQLAEKQFQIYGNEINSKKPLYQFQHVSISCDANSHMSFTVHSTRAIAKIIEVKVLYEGKVIKGKIEPMVQPIMGVTVTNDSQNFMIEPVHAILPAVFDDDNRFDQGATIDNRINFLLSCVFELHYLDKDNIHGSDKYSVIKNKNSNSPAYLLRKLEL